MLVRAVQSSNIGVILIIIPAILSKIFLVCFGGVYPFNVGPFGTMSLKPMRLDEAHLAIPLLNLVIKKKEHVPTTDF